MGILEKLQAVLALDETNDKLARISGMSQQAISKYRNGLSLVENMRLKNAINLIKFWEELEMKKDLTVRNLMFSHYDNGLHELEFNVNGTTVFVRNIDVDIEGDEDFWDDEENVKKAVDAADDDDIEIVEKEEEEIVATELFEGLEQARKEFNEFQGNAYLYVDFADMTAWTVVGNGVNYDAETITTMLMKGDFFDRDNRYGAGRTKAIAQSLINYKNAGYDVTDRSEDMFNFVNYRGIEAYANGKVVEF